MNFFQVPLCVIVNMKSISSLKVGNILIFVAQIVQMLIQITFIENLMQAWTFKNFTCINKPLNSQRNYVRYLKSCSYELTERKFDSRWYVAPHYPLSIYPLLPFVDLLNESISSRGIGQSRKNLYLNTK